MQLCLIMLNLTEVLQNNYILHDHFSAQILEMCTMYILSTVKLKVQFR